MLVVLQPTLWIDLPSFLRLKPGQIQNAQTGVLQLHYIHWIAADKYLHYSWECSNKRQATFPRRLLNSPVVEHTKHRKRALGTTVIHATTNVPPTPTAALTIIWSYARTGVLQLHYIHWIAADKYLHYSWECSNFRTSLLSQKPSSYRH